MEKLFFARSLRLGEGELLLNEEQTHGVKSLCALHLQFAWWSLACFVVLGTTLEVLHAFKIGWYLEQASETRRLMWTLAHAHGTLLSLVHAAFGLTCLALPAALNWRRKTSSALLMSASVLLPGGFFLGGAFIFEGDPGLGVWLVPLGAICLLVAVVLTAVDVSRRSEAQTGLV